MGDQQSNLLNELRPDDVPLREFLSVLTQRFSSSVSATETNSVLYPAQPPHELRLEFNKNGDLSGIFAFPTLSEDKLARIRADIVKEFVATSGLASNRHVFVS